MTGLTFLQALAAHLAWTEAKDGGTNTMLAVLFCLRNRVAAGWESGDLGRIVHACQYYRVVRDHTWEKIPEIPDIRDPRFYDLLGLVEGVFDNSLQDKLTEGALFWGDDPIGAKQRVAQVGTLILWK